MLMREWAEVCKPVDGVFLRGVLKHTIPREVLDRLNTGCTRRLHRLSEGFRLDVMLCAASSSNLHHACLSDSMYRI